MKKYNKNIHLVLKAGLIFSALIFNSSANAQLTNEEKICKAKLESIQPNDNKFKDLNKIYKKNLHFKLGQGHIMVPGWYADYDDIVKAKKEISGKDIPYIVYDLSRAEDLNSKQIVSLGVLKQFRLDALPCINAALSTRNVEKKICEGCSRLTVAKIDIEVNEKVNNNKFD